MIKPGYVLASLALTAAMVVSLPASASARAWKWCSSANEGTWHTGAYLVQNDNWGPGGPQRICANGPGDVRVVSNQNYGTQIVTYPDVGALYTGHDSPLSGFTAIRNHFTESFPADVVGEAADDVWFNDWGIEMMIWVDTHNEDPSYLPVLGHATIAGQHFTVYDNAPEYIFLLDHNETSGTTHILGAAKWLIAHKVMSASSGVTEAQFGWEIADTHGGPAVFRLTSYSLSAPPG